jgi:hypothetical protein
MCFLTRLSRALNLFGLYVQLFMFPEQTTDPTSAQRLLESAAVLLIFTLAIPPFSTVTFIRWDNMPNKLVLALTLEQGQHLD